MRRVTMAIAMAVLAAACGGNTAEEGEGQDDELSLSDFGVSTSRDVNPRATQMEVQEKIAECMTAEGWDYKPYVSASVAGGLGFAEYDEEEYRKTYGFGIATQSLLIKEELEAQRAGKTADPNAEIVKGLSDDERAAYNTALYGEPVKELTEEELEAMTDEERAEHNARQSGAGGGCYGEAWSQVVPDDGFFQEFGDALEDVYTRASADPRVVKAEADWSACMAERGHAFASQLEMQRYLYGEDPFGDEPGEFKKRVNEATGSSGNDAIVVQTDQTESGDDAEAPPGTAPEGDAEAPPEGDAEAPPEGDAEAPPGAAAPGGEGAGGANEELDLGVDMEKLQPLIDEEISMATSDWECGEDLRLLWEELYEEMERDFINTYRDRLLDFQKRNQ